MDIEVYGLDLLAGRGGANYTEDISPTLVRGDRTTHGVVYAIDQQGGKGQANYTKDVAPTIMADSHGTPHAVVLNDQGGRSINTEKDLSPTLRAQNHGHPPAVLEAKPLMVNLNKDDFQSKGIYHEDGVAPSLYAGEKRYGGGECYILMHRTFRKTTHPRNKHEGQGWEFTDINDTLNVFDLGEMRSPTLVVDQGAGKSSCTIDEELSPTLSTAHGGAPVIIEEIGR